MFWQRQSLGKSRELLVFNEHKTTRFGGFFIAILQRRQRKQNSVEVISNNNGERTRHQPINKETHHEIQKRRTSTAGSAGDQVSSLTINGLPIAGSVGNVTVTIARVDAWLPYWKWATEVLAEGRPFLPLKEFAVWKIDGVRVYLSAWFLEF